MACPHKNTRTEVTDEANGKVTDVICNDCGSGVSSTYEAK